ncbi:hypothetical protein BDZ88DRAFT_407193 [Geranomyces variabilis]|nr:hypothetical protein BDZ88DRAFT_407193 [Geranomyces variabilis]KAJ3139200.1 hypothetical protein HDU90_000564 [Geranomyces variabilis]
MREETNLPQPSSKLTREVVLARAFLSAAERGEQGCITMTDWQPVLARMQALTNWTKARPQSEELAEATQLLTVLLNPKVALPRPAILRTALAGLESVFHAAIFLHDSPPPDTDLLFQLVELLQDGTLSDETQPSTSYTCRILSTLGTCIDNPQAMQFIIRTKESAGLLEEANGICNNSLFSTHIRPLIRVNQSNKVLRALQGITAKIALYQGCAALRELSLKTETSTLDAGTWKDRCSSCLLRLYTLVTSKHGGLPEARMLNVNYFEKWHTLESIGKILASPYTSSHQASITAAARLMALLLTIAKAVTWLFPTTGADVQPLAWLETWCANFGVDLALFISQLGFPTDWPSQPNGIRDIASFTDADNAAALPVTAKDIVCLTALQFKAVITVRRLAAALERFDGRGSLASGPRQLLRSLLTMTGTKSGQQAVATALETCGGTLPLLRFCMPALKLPELASTQGDVEIGAEVLLVIMRTSASLTMLQDLATEALQTQDVPPVLDSVLRPLLSYRKTGLAGILLDLTRHPARGFSDIHEIVRVSTAISVLIEACEKDLTSVVSYVDDQELVTSHGTLAEVNAMTTIIQVLDSGVCALTQTDELLYGDLLNEATTEKAILEGGGISVQPIIFAAERKLALYYVVELCMKLLRLMIAAYDIKRYPRRHEAHAQLPSVMKIAAVGVSGQDVPSFLNAEEVAAKREPRSQGTVPAGARPSGPLFAVPDVLIRVLHVLGGGMGTAGNGHDWKCSIHAENALRDAMKIMRDLVRYVAITPDSRDTAPEILVYPGEIDAGDAVLMPRFMLPLGSILRQLFETISYDNPQLLITGLSLLSALLPAQLEVYENGEAASAAIASEPPNAWSTLGESRDGLLDTKYWQEGLRPLRGELFRILRITLATSSGTLYESASKCFSRLVQTDLPDGNGSPYELARSIVGILLEEAKRCYKDDASSAKAVPACDGPRAMQRVRFLNDVTRSEHGRRALTALNAERNDVSAVLAGLVVAFNDQTEIRLLCASLARKIECQFAVDEAERSSAESEERKGKRPFADAAPGSECQENGVVKEEADMRSGTEDVQDEAAHRAKRVRFDQAETEASEAAHIGAPLRPAPAQIAGLQSLIAGFDFGAWLPPDEIPTPRQLASYLNSRSSNDIPELSEMAAVSLSTTLPVSSGSASAVAALSVAGGVAATTTALGPDSPPSAQTGVSYRQYTKDEFRTTHHTKRKMNASRPPSVHVDRFGRLPPQNQPQQQQQQQLLPMGGNMPRLSNLPQPPALDYDHAAMAAAAAAAAASHHRSMFMQGPPPSMMHARVGGPAAAAAAAAAASLFPPPQLSGREWEQGWDPSTLPPAAGTGTGPWGYPPGFYPGWWGA